MRPILVSISSLLLFSAGLRSQQNPALKRELDSLFALDQRYRAELSLAMQGRSDSLARLHGVGGDSLVPYLWGLQNAIDSSNTKRLEAIIAQHGYPGLTLVGPSTAEAGFYILQHSAVIGKYLPVIKAAAQKGEIRFVLYAMMLDRWLMFNDRAQVYGTQGTGFDVLNPKTGRWERRSIIWPIRDPAGVNRRRKAAGFKDSVEENARQLGIHYKVYRLAEVLKLRQLVIDSS